MPVLVLLPKTIPDIPFFKLSFPARSGTGGHKTLNYGRK
jgi:hypothetical protein